MESKYKEDVMQLFHDKRLVKICAPMVRYSKLQFRTLVREYKCDLCFTPMILADSFCQSEKARHNEFSTNLRDSPVIVQFAANTIHDFIGAAHLVSPYCSGVDLNCGCPQRWAKNQGIGCSMLTKPEIIYDLVRQCRNHISKPFTISVKMRILQSLKDTISICQQLEHCGVSFLTVHGRTANQRSVGPVDIKTLALVSESVQCPVIANGGVRTLEDARVFSDLTRCKGVMVASALLANPALFTGINTTPLDCVQNWVDICYNSILDINSIDCYNNLIENTVHTFHNKNDILSFQCFHHHLVFMLQNILPKYSRKVFNNLQTFESVLQFLADEFDIKPNVFPLEKYKLNERMPLSFKDRNEIYLDLKADVDTDFNYDLTYNSDKTDGKYFNFQKNVDDSDTYISSLFL